MKKYIIAIFITTVVHANNIHQHRILILDFGSQYTQLIARRIREQNVYCEIHPYDISDEQIKQIHPKGIILSGGPETVTLKETPRAPKTIFDMKVPILGICYGMHTMAEQLGGTVTRAAKKEFGHAEVSIQENQSLLSDETKTVWMSHGDEVTKVPQDFSIAATSDSCIAMMAHKIKPWFGVQFHPEVTQTEKGTQLFNNFITLCDCDREWTTPHIIEHSITQIKKSVENQDVLVAVSGGVDSLVTAVLLHRAIGDQLHCVFVDNGLLRLHEVEEVTETFKKMNIPLITVDAKERFLEKLKSENDPEKKRKIIGHEFIAVFEQEAHKLNNLTWLAQGTIYPDVVESAKTKSGKTHVIKSHHNVGGLPENMKLKLIEPLRELFKDEVRKVGSELGIPHAILYRHPFPGPGLAIRVLGQIKPEYLKKLALADYIFLEELKNQKLYDYVSQAFAVFLPVKSVGVKGDARHYEHVIALRAVETVDFMTARWAQLPYAFLRQVANRIINEVPGISRVTYDISSKPPATIEWE